jgi:hypothetical protein
VDAAAGLFDVSVTTELDILRGAVDPHRVPRLDMYYLRDGARLATWGSRGFQAYLSLRRGARRVRAVLSRGRG